MGCNHIALIRKHGINVQYLHDNNSARRWYAPHDLAKVNNSEIERVTEMDKKKLFILVIIIRICYRLVSLCTH